MNPDVTFRAQFLRMMVIAALSASTFAPSIASAANKYWIGGSDWWDVGTNWSPSGQPQNGDYVYLTQSDSANRTVYYANTLYPSAGFVQLYIDATSTGTITLDQSKDPLTSYTEYVGYSGTGTHAQSGGTNTVTGVLFLGTNSGSAGTYNLSGTGNLAASGTGTSEYIGYFGNGTFNQSGGTHTVSGYNLILGYGSGTNGLGTTRSTGTYNLSGGSLTAGTEYIGKYGSGVFTQSGGTHSVSVLYLGYDSIGSFVNGTYVLTRSSGTYNLSGGSLTAGYEGIGYSGYGTFNHSGGFNTVNGTLNIGANSTYNLSGTGNLTAGFETLGSNGGSSFIQVGGTNSVSGTLSIGEYLGTSTYELSGGSLSANNAIIGNYGVGIFTQNGGTHTVTNSLTVGTYNSGTYNLNAGTLSVDGNIASGTGTSTLNIGNGTLTVGGGNGSINVGNLVLGSIAGSNVNYTLSNTGLYQGANKVAGALTTGNLIIGRDGTGTFTQTSGANLTTGTITIAANSGSSGTYNFDGGTLHAANITVNSGGAFNFNGGTLSVGQFTGNLANLGGTLAPGNSPGTTNITGDYSQSNAGTFAVEIGGTGPGQFDVLHVSGTATLDGTLSVSLFDLGSGLFTPHAGDSFDILTADILNGQFSSLSLAALGDGLSWNVSYLTDAIGTTDIVRLTAVPLPTAFWLFGSGLLGLIGTARKRARKRLT